jgi:hypothetical protein
MAGAPEQPVVLLEVQMHSKKGFKHQLFGQTARLLQIRHRVQHLEVVVMVPDMHLKLGPAQRPRHVRAFLADVHWLSLEELGQQPGSTPCSAC